MSADFIDETEFTLLYAKASGITHSELMLEMEAKPCRCGDKDCQGWKMVKRAA